MVVFYMAPWKVKSNRRLTSETLKQIITHI
jgi:hypothetical protein